MSTMRIGFYVPERLYGFCDAEDGSQVFFHASVFHRLSPDEPPPIVGEPVLVELGPPPRSADAAPRAASVRRLEAPVRIAGMVGSFDPARGWGFVRGEDGVERFLHRSDVLQGRMPVRGQTVRFYGGEKRGRLRACHVEV